VCQRVWTHTSRPTSISHKSLLLSCVWFKARPPGKFDTGESQSQLVHSSPAAEPEYQRISLLWNPAVGFTRDASSSTAVQILSTVSAHLSPLKMHINLRCRRLICLMSLVLAAAGLWDPPAIKLKNIKHWAEDSSERYNTDKLCETVRCMLKSKPLCGKRHFRAKKKAYCFYLKKSQQYIEKLH